MKKFIKQINIFLILSIIVIFSHCFGGIITLNYTNNNTYQMYQAGYSKYQQQDYNGAIEILKPINESCEGQEICQHITDLLKYCYWELGNQYFDEKNYRSANKNFQEALKLDEENPILMVNIGTSYLQGDQLEKALIYYKKAQAYPMDDNMTEIVKNNINYIENTFETQQKIGSKSYKSHTNDSLNKYQYYLEEINVYKARNLLPENTNTVTIAIIDDGVYIKHSDLKTTIRHNPGEIQGNGIDDDNNGYTDDYYGWNFDQNNTKLAPVTSHGTTIAGVIGATTNNGQWIAGISPNVKIIPLSVFATGGYANVENIIPAIEYAIDKGANIINLSLGSDSSQDYLYNPEYDKVIKKAHEKGIIIVIAAGNGKKINDTESIGINTTTERISPVCNESSNRKMIIGVGALDVNGNVSKRSNYGNCVDFYAPGENIASIGLEKEYFQISNGTSLSAPIIAGIIALGYNKYGETPPDIVYDALINSKKGNTIDAVLYLNSLENYFNSIGLNELKSAINWMHSKGLTIFNTPESFMYQNGLRRDEAAKFFVKYAKEILDKTPDTSKLGCDFFDLVNARPDLQDIVVESCQLGLFQGYQGHFMPDQKLTNAQALAVFIRMIDGRKDETGGHFAENYLQKAQELGITQGLSLDDKSLFDQSTTRGAVAQMIYRTVEK